MYGGRGHPKSGAIIQIKKPGNVVASSLRLILLAKADYYIAGFSVRQYSNTNLLF
jgi:hypothetical protein